ncbi:MAG: hypothetical protein JWN15_1128, partial [Firmicutes bacterium]|nr:hypothetical protein [Bacillota bacterium]
MNLFLGWTAIGGGQVLLITLVLALLRSVRLRRHGPDSTPSHLWSTNPVVMLALVLGEEWLFRSLVVGYLTPRVGLLWAVGISAAVFTLAHVPNGVVNVWTPVNLLLFSVLAGLVYVRFGLAAVTGLHYGWNLMQWPILGYPLYGGGHVGRWF